jgi:hypothetical protein
MAKNQIFDQADSVSLPVAADTASGVAVMVGALAGTTRCAEGTGGNPDGYATVDLVGAYEQTVTGALTPGAAVYITSGGALNTTASGNTLWGYSLTTKGSGAGLATIRPARV